MRPHAILAGKIPPANPACWRAGKAPVVEGEPEALRRARSWRWEPPGADATVADEHAQQRWAEAHKGDHLGDGGDE